MRGLRHSRALSPLIPPIPFLSWVGFLARDMGVCQPLRSEPAVSWQYGGMYRSTHQARGMTRSDGLSQGRETVSRPMPHRSQPQASVLALRSFAMAPAPRCGITGGGAAIAPPVGRAAATVRRRLREWRYETARTAGTKRGVTRQALDVTTYLDC